MKNTYILMILLSPLYLRGQLTLSSYYAFGGNAVSEGIYFQNHVLASHQFKPFILGGGVQFTASYADQQLFSGYFLKGAAQLFPERFPMLVSLVFLRRPYSRLLSENNVALMIQHRWKHFELILGNSMRIWKLSSHEMQPLGLTDAGDRSIIEYRNLLYRLTWYLKPVESDWNLSFSLTDFDDFLFQRGTNPLLTSAFTKMLNAKLEWFTELWFQGAGMFNLQADAFGMYFKTGLIWRF